MNSSEAPVEALAFSYLSFGFFMAVNNNIWTWIAVVTTAAVSFWRVRTSSTPSHIPNNLINDPFLPPSPLAVDTRLVAEQETSISSNSDTIVSSPTVVFETETKASRKYSVYYQWDDDNNYRNDVVHHRCEKDLVPVATGVGDKWEPIMMKLKIEKYKELYSYQDLSMLDGSIVRLWEGCRRRRETAPHRLVTLSGGGGGGGGAVGYVVGA